MNNIIFFPFLVLARIFGLNARLSYEYIYSLFSEAACPIDGMRKITPGSWDHLDPWLHAPRNEYIIKTKARMHILLLNLLLYKPYYPQQ